LTKATKMMIKTRELTGKGVEVAVDEYGTVWHYLDLATHREDGPAIVYADGSVEY
jgi:hypothetical protein